MKKNYWRFTDKKYEAARNELIPEAEEYADKFVGPKPKGNLKVLCNWNNDWNRVFHSKMDMLAKDKL